MDPVWAPGAAQLVDPRLEAWAFAGMEALWAAFEPLTPWGRDERDRRLLMAERSAIEAAWNETDRYLILLSRRPGDPALVKAAWHLGRMPRLPLDAREAYELAEIFQVKKFLANYRGLVDALGPDAASFGLARRAEPLRALLDLGGSDAESFYLAEAYDEALADTRAAIRRCDAAIQAARSQAEAALEARSGIRMEGRDFVVVPRALAIDLAEEGGRWLVEPWDEAACVLRLAPGPELLALLSERERLAAFEREREERVLAALSAQVVQALPELRAAVAAVQGLDLARARAKAAERLGLVRPMLSEAPDSALEIEGGRRVATEAECARLGLSYTPLDLRLPGGAALVFGSNMGGKTVVLATVLQLQLAAQAGLFVPARAFRTRVFARIAYVGERSGERLEGLSGFGVEVRALRGIVDEPRSLVAFDELARTTGSLEAEALLSATLERRAAMAGSLALFSTHFRGVARLSGVLYLRMRGLDREAAAECLESEAPLAERLAGINRHMRYQALPDSGAAESSDALAIAGLLGLQGPLLDRAGDFLATSIARRAPGAAPPSHPERHSPCAEAGEGEGPSD